MSKLRVFVSHLTVEAKFADLLQSCLRRDFIGLLELFISSDATSIPVGTDWLEKLLAGLRAAELQFVICSPDSVRMPWLNYESGAARVRGVEVIPLCHSGIVPDQLPVPLCMSEGVVLTEAAGLRKLYTRIAEILSSDVPDVSFDGYAAQFRELEADYARQRAQDAAAKTIPNNEGIVEDPRVVCVTSAQFTELGYKNQIDVVLKAFPQTVQHGVVNTRCELEKLLMTERVDILHIATFVCPRSGVLYFSRVDLPSGTPAEDEVEVVQPEALATLVKGAHTRLVVITSGNSLALVTTLLDVTNVIAPSDMVSAKALAVWVQSFYEALRMRSLAEACEYAVNASQVPIRLLSQQRAMPEIRFRGSSAATEGARNGEPVATA
jgi:hypothetical protein